MPERQVLTSAQIAAIIAEHLGIDEDDFSYMWKVEDDGTFAGIVIL